MASPFFPQLQCWGAPEEFPRRALFSSLTCFRFRLWLSIAPRSKTLRLELPREQSLQRIDGAESLSAGERYALADPALRSQRRVTERRTHLSELRIDLPLQPPRRLLLQSERLLLQSEWRLLLQSELLPVG